VCYQNNTKDENLENRFNLPLDNRYGKIIYKELLKEALQAL